jgi:hypothetical protein
MLPHSDPPGIGSSDRFEVPSTTELITATDFGAHHSVREIVFASDSRCRTIDGFGFFVALFRIVIPSSVEVIGPAAFSDCESLTEVIFETGSRVKKVRGFQKCTALSRIIIPPSVEVIAREAFFGCASLTEVIFEIRSKCQAIHGFEGCTSLRRISLPPSLRLLSAPFEPRAFRGCSSLRCVEFADVSQVKDHWGFCQSRLFIAYEAEHLKARRRGFHDKSESGRRVFVYV